jgi:hypothetical protein
MLELPVQVSVRDDLARSRLTVFFRLLLAIPHLLWLYVWASAVWLAALVAWVAAPDPRAAAGPSSRPSATLSRAAWIAAICVRT